MNPKQVIYQMLLENTGTFMMDSGGVYNRHRQRNQWKTLTDFEQESEVTVHVGVNDIYQLEISLFHYLTKHDYLQIDAYGYDYNREIVCWEGECSELYGVNEKQLNRLQSHGFYTAIANQNYHIINSCNRNSILSQAIQGTLSQHENGLWYVLLQIHGGCDVRGGYTDARLFYLPNHCLPLESVCGTYQQQEVYNQDEGDILYYNDTDEKINVITDSITLSLA